MPHPTTAAFTPAAIPPSIYRRKPLHPALPSSPFYLDSDSEEILCPDSSDTSSDEDSHNTAQIQRSFNKRRARADRVLQHAERYLKGCELYIHCATVRGPFERNPWAKTTRRGGIEDREEEEEEVVAKEARDGREKEKEPVEVEGEGEGEVRQATTRTRTKRRVTIVETVKRKQKEGEPQPQPPTTIRTATARAMAAVDTPTPSAPVVRRKRDEARGLGNYFAVRKHVTGDLGKMKAKVTVDVKAKATTTRRAVSEVPRTRRKEENPPLAEDDFDPDVIMETASQPEMPSFTATMEAEDEESITGMEETFDSAKHEEPIGIDIAVRWVAAAKGGGQGKQNRIDRNGVTASESLTHARTNSGHGRNHSPPPPVRPPPSHLDIDSGESEEDTTHKKRKREKLELPKLMNHYHHQQQQMTQEPEIDWAKKRKKFDFNTASPLIQHGQQLCYPLLRPQLHNQQPVPSYPTYDRRKRPRTSGELMHPQAIPEMLYKPPSSDEFNRRRLRERSNLAEIVTDQANGRLPPENDHQQQPYLPPMRSPSRFREMESIREAAVRSFVLEGSGNPAVLEKPENEEEAEKENVEASPKRRDRVIRADLPLPPSSNPAERDGGSQPQRVASTPVNAGNEVLEPNSNRSSAPPKPESPYFSTQHHLMVAQNSFFQAIAESPLRFDSPDKPVAGLLLPGPSAGLSNPPAQLQPGCSGNGSLTPLNPKVFSASFLLAQSSSPALEEGDESTLRGPIPQSRLHDSKSLDSTSCSPPPKQTRSPQPQPQHLEPESDCDEPPATLWTNVLAAVNIQPPTTQALATPAPLPSPTTARPSTTTSHSSPSSAPKRILHLPNHTPITPFRALRTPSPEPCSTAPCRTPTRFSTSTQKPHIQVAASPPLPSLGFGTAPVLQSTLKPSRSPQATQKKSVAFASFDDDLDSSLAPRESAQNKSLLHSTIGSTLEDTLPDDSSSLGRKFGGGMGQQGADWGSRRNLRFSGGEEEETTIEDAEGGEVTHADDTILGGSQGEDLLKEVAGFMGADRWDIDEELRKMAGVNNEDSEMTPKGRNKRGSVRGGKARRSGFGMGGSGSFGARVGGIGGRWK